LTKVVIDLSMPLDGFVAGPGDTGIDHIFEWYFVKSDALSSGIARTTSPTVGRPPPSERVPVFVLTHDPPADYPRGPSNGAEETR
jgi:hypothetical protein